MQGLVTLWIGWRIGHRNQTGFCPHPTFQGFYRGVLHGHAALCTGDIHPSAKFFWNSICPNFSHLAPSPWKSGSFLLTASRNFPYTSNNGTTKNSNTSESSKQEGSASQQYQISAEGNSTNRSPDPHRYGGTRLHPRGIFGLGARATGRTRSGRNRGGIMTDIRLITRSWPLRARWARAMAYGAFASVGVFAGLVAGVVARGA